MSKVQLQGNASGTGIFTIASPNSNTDRTLTLPNNTGTLLSDASTISVANLPSGSVLQVVALSISDVSITAGTSANVVNQNITTVGANSKFYIYGSVIARSDSGSDVGLGLSITMGGNTFYPMNAYMVDRWAGSVSGGSFRVPVGIGASYTSSFGAGTTQSVVVTLQMYSSNGGAEQNGASGQKLILLEVKP